MIRELIQEIKLHKGSMLGMWLTIPIGFAMGFGILCLIMLLDETTTEWAPLGTIGSLFPVALVMIVGFLGYRQEFMLALTMGRRRKAFMLAYALRQTVWALVAYGIVLTLCQVETVLAGLMFGGKPLTEDISVGLLLKWQFLVPWVLGLVLLNMFLGALYSRFGKPFGMVLYFVWIGSCILLPEMLEKMPGVTGWFAALPWQAWAGIGLAAAVAMTVTVVALGRKQMVR